MFHNALYKLSKTVSVFWHNWPLMVCGLSLTVVFSTFKVTRNKGIFMPVALNTRHGYKMNFIKFNLL